MKLRFLILIVVLLALGCKSEGEYSKAKDGQLSWIDIKTAANIANAEKKKYFVDVYTEWCGWCKVMDKKTFTDSKVIDALSKDFHVVKFDAEMKETINFNGTNYDFMPAGQRGVNMLAAELLQGQLSYPSFVFLDENRKPIKISKGFMEPAAFLTEIAAVTGKSY